MESSEAITTDPNLASCCAEKNAGLKVESDLGVETAGDPTSGSGVDTTGNPTSESGVETTGHPTSESGVDTTGHPTSESGVDTTGNPTSESEVETAGHPTSETGVETTGHPTSELPQPEYIANIDGGNDIVGDEAGGDKTLPLADSQSVEQEDENSRDSQLGGSTPQKKKRITNSKLVLKGLPQGLGAESLFEYRWPLSDDNSEYYMLQEQLSVFLDVKSFRRKYPDLQRRQIDIEERNYLKEIGVVTEMQCDLGLTALKSDEISDVMLKDYPEKYEEYAKVLHKREEIRRAKQQQEIQEQTTNTPQSLQSAEGRRKSHAVTKSDMKRMMERAVKAAANYNAFIMRERREERKHYFDIQTGVVQCQKGKYSVLPPEATRPSPYPVAVLRGQYAEYYHRYTPDELKYLPLKTVLYDPPIRISNPYIPLPKDPSEEIQEETTPNQPSIIPATVSTVENPPTKKHVTKLLETNCCICGLMGNKKEESEKCIQCNQCQRASHPSCCELSDEMLAVVLTYKWMCMECKVCVKCSDPGNEDKMIVCDKCDRGYHTFCVGLKDIPNEKIWACPQCELLMSSQ